MSTPQPDVKDRRRRSWPQRVLLVVNLVLVVTCFGVAAGVLIGRHYGNTIPRVELAEPEPAAPAGTEAFPEADPGSKNFLITGADNNACVDPDSPFAGAFGDRDSMGERSDTIMVMRVDPAERRAAVLSLPRDLYVEIPGRGKSRINSAYVRNDPSKLIETIAQNFGVGVDHFIQVDFCAFRTVVDAVGGVTIPFEHPAQDVNTGLYVPEPGCVTFDGDHALAYVRSRHYQYFVDGRWRDDGTSDLGRVSRQQDFLRRVLSSALAQGFDPGVARGIMDAVKNFVVVDDGLTPGNILEFAGLVSGIEPGSIATYQIQTKGAVINDSSVLLAQLESDQMQTVLAIFRGQAPIIAAPAVHAGPASTVAIPGTVPGTAPATSTPGTSTATPADEPIGVVPPKDGEC